MKARLLILSLYYPPDLSACSFRSSALVTALRELAPDLTIDVITSLPNRYSSFTSAAPALETDGVLTVHRLPMPAHKGDMRTQASAYARFARNAARLASRQRYDLIFATSSRLMTAALGSWVSRRSGTPLYLDIRDLFADTMGDILPRSQARVLAPALSGIEGWTMRRAAHINLVSPGFGDYFRERYPHVPLSFYTNGIDDEFLVPRADGPQAATPGPVRVVYAGNIGEGQGLHTIVPSLANALSERITFTVIGDGGRRTQLVDALTSAGVANVELVPPMSRDQLIEAYLAADVLFLHLNAHEAFTRVLPSKIFEYAALGRPIWAGVAGYAAEFLKTEVPNAAVFAPCDVEAGLAAFRQLALQPTPRPDFVARHSRRAITRELARSVLGHLPTTPVRSASA